MVRSYCSVEIRGNAQVEQKIQYDAQVQQGKIAAIGGIPGDILYLPVDPENP
jgi:hypothetical protein